MSRRPHELALSGAAASPPAEPLVLDRAGIKTILFEYGAQGLALFIVIAEQEGNPAGMSLADLARRAHVSFITVKRILELMIASGTIKLLGPKHFITTGIYR